MDGNIKKIRIFNIVDIELTGGKKELNDRTINGEIDIGAPTIPIRDQIRNLFVFFVSVSTNILLRTTNTAGEMIHPNGPPRVPPNTARIYPRDFCERGFVLSVGDIRG